MCWLVPANTESLTKLKKPRLLLVSTDDGDDDSDDEFAEIIGIRFENLECKDGGDDGCDGGDDGCGGDNENGDGCDGDKGGDDGDEGDNEGDKEMMSRQHS